MEKDELFCDCEMIHEEVVENARAKMPDEDELYDLADFFKIFGDSTRVKIIWALDEQEMCVCDIAALLNMSKSAISHQLRTLKQADLVKHRRDGKVVYYSLKDDHVKDIFEKGMEHIREKYIQG